MTRSLGVYWIAKLKILSSFTLPNVTNEMKKKMCHGRLADTNGVNNVFFFLLKDS